MMFQIDLLNYVATIFHTDNPIIKIYGDKVILANPRDPLTTKELNILKQNGIIFNKETQTYIMKL